METTRQNKISRLIQKELSEIFLLQTKSMNGVLVSVSAVRISPDMSIARVYLSVFPSERSQEIVKNINDNMKSIRYELGTRVRHQLRIIPELKFFVEIILKNWTAIDSILYGAGDFLLHDSIVNYGVMGESWWQPWVRDFNLLILFKCIYPNGMLK